MRFDKTLVLETDRCQLRFVSLDNIPHIFSATRFEGFNDGMLWEPPSDESELVAPFERNVKKWEEGTAYTFTIVDKETQAFIGRISIRSEEDPEIWNLGFWTHPSKQKNGYMTEAANRVIEFGFRELELSKIIAYHASWNAASRKVLERTGMSFVMVVEKAFKKKGSWVAENLFQISAEDWPLNGVT